MSRRGLIDDCYWRHWPKPSRHIYGCVNVQQSNIQNVTSPHYIGEQSSCMPHCRATSAANLLSSGILSHIYIAFSALAGRQEEHWTCKNCWMFVSCTLVLVIYLTVALHVSEFLCCVATVSPSPPLSVAAAKSEWFVILVLTFSGCPEQAVKTIRLMVLFIPHTASIIEFF